MLDRQEKVKQLKDFFQAAGSVMVAYSGGVDSTFLLKIGTDTIGADRCAGVTIDWEAVPQADRDTASRLAAEHNFTHFIVPFKGMIDDNFIKNTPMRCYNCKKALFTFLKTFCREKGFAMVVDGGNLDDHRDYRPGRKALEELGIRSPLSEAGFTKDDIRQVAHEIGLGNWNRASAACLASRFPYGTKITSERLDMIDDAERFLKIVGLNQVRVRFHEQVARIEVKPEEFETFLDEDIREAIVYKFKDLGFPYTSIDLQGYRMGSLNEPLNESVYP